MLGEWDIRPGVNGTEGCNPQGRTPPYPRDSEAGWVASVPLSSCRCLCFGLRLCWLQTHAWGSWVYEIGSTEPGTAANLTVIKFGKGGQQEARGTGSPQVGHIRETEPTSCHIRSLIDHRREQREQKAVATTSTDDTKSQKVKV